MKSHLRILLDRHKALGKQIKNPKAEYGKDCRHGGGLIFFGLDIIFIVVVLIVVEIFVIIAVGVVAPAIAGIPIAPVAVIANRTIDHGSIFERWAKCFLSYVGITFADLSTHTIGKIFR